MRRVLVRGGAIRTDADYDTANYVKGRSVYIYGQHRITIGDATHVLYTVAMHTAVSGG